MTDKNLVNDNGQAVSKPNKQTVTLRPLVNIVEADNGFTLTAEMPGVPKEKVSVDVENGTLTLCGDIELPIPDGMQSTHTEVQTMAYKRAFTLSRELDTTKIEASQVDGVLTVRIPKAEYAQARKIEVQVA